MRGSGKTRWIGQAVCALALSVHPGTETVGEEPPGRPAEPVVIASNPVGGHDPSGELAESLRDRREQLHREWQRRGFTVTVQSPFVVVGNEPPDRVRQRASGTVRWALGHLNRDYFQTAPRRAIEFWVLGDEATYRATAQERLAIRPSTPFGFFSPAQSVIVVNGATGAGTLVHEMVHALLAEDFADCPPWFNEGFASLFEECEERQGTIWGLPNWRLRRLQQAVAQGELPRLERLCGLNADAFYGAGNSLHYAQARSLCLYLQDQGVLRGYYARFRESHQHDPTGYATLRAVLGDMTPVELERAWAAYVSALVLPEAAAMAESGAADREGKSRAVQDRGDERGPRK